MTGINKQPGDRRTTVDEYKEETSGTAISRSIWTLSRLAGAAAILAVLVWRVTRARSWRAQTDDCLGARRRDGDHVADHVVLCVAVEPCRGRERASGQAVQALLTLAVLLFSAPPQALFVSWLLGWSLPSPARSRSATLDSTRRCRHDHGRLPLRRLADGPGGSRPRPGRRRR